MDVEIKKIVKDEYGRIVRLEYYKNDEKYKRYRERRKKRVERAFLIITSIITAIMLLSLFSLIIHTL